MLTPAVIRACDHPGPDTAAVAAAAGEESGGVPLGRHSVVDLVDGRRYHIGLIDLLQVFHTGKQMEGWFKGASWYS